MLAPIILFVYNRPEHTRRTIEALKKNELASESVLYVFADGPKMNMTKEQLIRIDEVHRLIHAICGFKNIIIEESEKNKGLANSVITGVTKVVNQYGKVIVLEDDMETHPQFLSFMNRALNFYKNDNRIYSIGGFIGSMSLAFPKHYIYDVILSPRFECWGWATWLDRWQMINWDISSYSIFKNKKEIKHLNKGGDDLWCMLQLQANGKINSWAIRFQYCMTKNNCYCLLPMRTLVHNCGQDGTGTHSISNKDSVLNLPFYAIEKYSFDDNIPVSREFLKNVQKVFSKKTNKKWYEGIIYRIRKFKLIVLKPFA